MLIAEAPIDAPAPEAVMARARTENFPVASRLLPARERRHLLAVYGFARLVDELGDATAAERNAAATPHGERSATAGADERLAALDWVEQELDRSVRGEAEHPLLVCLGATLRECSLPREPFARLIEANRVDQRVSRYQTWTQLRGYCALSADPVGEIVLGIFGLATPERIGLSDSICTALQLTEHCQDVAEDMARGRVYLPAEDMARFGCEQADLVGAHASPALREVLAFEVARARSLLAQGAPLIAQLHGRPRLAVAAFAAGGSAALDTIEHARYDVLAGAPRAGRAQRLRALARTLRAGHGAGARSAAA